MKDENRPPTDRVSYLDYCENIKSQDTKVTESTIKEPYLNPYVISLIVFSFFVMGTGSIVFGIVGFIFLFTFITAMNNVGKETK